jgi:hypothetical protein
LWLGGASAPSGLALLGGPTEHLSGRRPLKNQLLLGWFMFPKYFASPPPSIKFAAFIHLSWNVEFTIFSQPQSFFSGFFMRPTRFILGAALLVPLLAAPLPMLKPPVQAVV